MRRDFIAKPTNPSNGAPHQADLSGVTPLEEARKYFDAAPSLQRVIIFEEAVYRQQARPLLAFSKIDGEVQEYERVRMGWGRGGELRWE